jgi:ABC-type transporter MlaC component
MKKILFLLFAIAAITSCSKKTNVSTIRPNNASSEVDSIVANKTDTLNTVEAVKNQVNAVYSYWNEQRQHYDENMPTLDSLFGSKEWQRVRNEVIAIDRECECGGFFDFGDEGPLDPWTYDCYEGMVSADSIQIKMHPNGTADVRFLVKDAVTIKGIPIRWLMQVEDGQWKVANIFFEKDDNFDILMNMRAYADHEKHDNTNLSEYAE